MSTLHAEIAKIASQFPGEFALRGYEDEHFRLNLHDSTYSDRGLLIAVDRLNPDNSWSRWMKMTPNQLRKSVARLKTKKKSIRGRLAKGIQMTRPGNRPFDTPSMDYIQQMSMYKSRGRR